MSEITGTAVAHEAYAFCCMRCGHGWEQSYDIEHYVDGSGQNVVVYKSDGIRVPSPLSSPSCGNCGGHVVRIMRSGQVSSVQALMTEHHHPARTSRAAKKAAEAKAAETAGAETAGAETAGAETAGAEAAARDARPDGGISDGPDDADHTHHHWHLADLLHPFQHHHRP
ncbi:hypothetical protein [Streptomyces corynorhini]|uniref:C2H2-type domain-containing protein n=1 Tax=Streptomyces corynorhini TaxID=2282652 RepID=A0A370AWC6_9ACTN|nr:hypothetical protein [Streptomyces corynorhini]RDG33957.1 hypothetical protein DVH02_30985 [Streptomyces corynorhini]